MPSHPALPDGQGAAMKTLELYSCWRFINKAMKEPGTGVSDRTCAADVLDRVRSATVAPMPSTTKPKPAHQDSTHGAQAMPTSPAPAPKQQPGQQPPSAVKREHAAAAASHPATAPALPLACGTATGDATRDRTLCSLYTALASNSAVNLAETAAELERCVYAATCGTAAAAEGGGGGGGDGSPGHGYLKRAFVVWGLISPESTGYSADVAELLLEGSLSPKSLAGLELDSPTGGGTAAS